MTAAALPVPAEQTDVALAVRGDGAAFERLYRAHVARVNALARWLLGGDDVEDAVQEVFIRVWEKLGTYSGDAAFGTWLHRVAVNHFLRRRARRSIHRARTSESDQAMNAAAAPQTKPELRIAIERAVDQLPAGAQKYSSSTTWRDTSTRRSPGCWRSIQVRPDPSCTAPVCCSGSSSRHESGAAKGQCDERDHAQPVDRAAVTIPGW
jgi:RNA polymerase sigma-70 factor (ECF subfamily)